MTPTKREVLLAICETPGWEAPENSSTVEKHVEGLFAQGLIKGRNGGWEATPPALDAYPDFVDYPDMASQESIIAAPASWVEMALPSFHLRGLQRAESKIEFGNIAGGVVLVNESATKVLTEVEIIIRTRTVSDR